MHAGHIVRSLLTIADFLDIVSKGIFSVSGRKCGGISGVLDVRVVLGDCGTAFAHGKEAAHSKSARNQSISPASALN